MAGMPVNFVPFLYCHGQNLGLDRSQVLVGLFQSMSWPSWHSSFSPPAYLMLRGLAIARWGTCSSYSSLWHSQPFVLFFITLLNDPALSGYITWPIHCSSIFPWRSHLHLLFVVRSFPGMHSCTPLAEQFLPAPPGPASLLHPAQELPPCYCSNPGSMHVVSTSCSQEDVPAFIMSLVTLWLPFLLHCKLKNRRLFISKISNI